MTLSIGVDLDNTIACYDGVFHRLALEQGLIPAQLPVSRHAVRDYLRGGGQEDAWTELQGHAYGPGMAEAYPFPGVTAFFAGCRARGIPVAIISHRTRYPCRGPRFDLHQAARDWLERHGCFGLDPGLVYLEPSRQAKLARIAGAGCTRFIDDLPECLGEPEFPPGVDRILFDPDRRWPEEQRFNRIAAWEELAAAMFAAGGAPA